MANADHQRFERLMDELILRDEDSVDDAQQIALRDHIAGCKQCRERYNRVSMAERMLHGGPRGLEDSSPRALARVGALVMAESAPPASGWQGLVQWLAPPRRWGTLATVTAMAVLLPFFVLRPHDGEFQSRGGTQHERTAGVRAFCLDATGVTPHCTRASQMRLTVSNAGQFRYVFLLGIDEQLEVKWYAPHAPDGTSIAAPAGTDVPIGDAVRLGVNHEPGPVRIYAIFSDAPVTAAEIEATVERMHETHLLPSQAGVLPLQRTDIVQHSVILDIAP